MVGLGELGAGGRAAALSWIAGICACPADDIQIPEEFDPYATSTGASTSTTTTTTTTTENPAMGPSRDEPYVAPSECPQSVWGSECPPYESVGLGESLAGVVGLRIDLAGLAIASGISGDVDARCPSFDSMYTFLADWAVLGPGRTTDSVSTFGALQAGSRTAAGPGLCRCVIRRRAGERGRSGLPRARALRARGGPARIARIKITRPDARSASQ